MALSAPVLLDPGRTLATALGVKYFAIVVYKPNGKIVKEVDEGYLRVVSTSDDHVDALVDQ